MDSTAVSQSSPRRIVEVHRRRLGWDQSGSQTLAKGLTLLELVADREGGYGVGLVELARELGWNKSTTHRLLATLVSLGYAQQNPESGWYRIGLKAFQLGAAYSRDLDLRREAAPSLIDLQRETDQCVSLVVLDAATKEVVYIDRVESNHPLRMHTPIGARFPWNCTEPARRSWRLFRRSRPSLLLTGELPAAPRPPSTSPKLCGHILAKSGPMATQRTMKRTLTVFAASPRRFFNSAGRAIAAISISGHSGQIAVKWFPKLGMAVRNAADRVSRRLGYKGV